MLLLSLICFDWSCEEIKIPIGSAWSKDDAARFLWLTILAALAWVSTVLLPFSFTRVSVLLPSPMRVIWSMWIISPRFKTSFVARWQMLVWSVTHANLSDYFKNRVLLLDGMRACRLRWCFILFLFDLVHLNWAHRLSRRWAELRIG